MREKTMNMLFHNSEAKFSKRGCRYTFACPLRFPHPGHHQLRWGVVSAHHLSFSHVYPTQHPQWGSKNTKHATPLLNTIHGSPLPSKQFSNFPTRLQNLLIMIRSLPTSSDSSLIIIIIPHFLPSMTMKSSQSELHTVPTSSHAPSHLLDFSAYSCFAQGMSISPPPLLPSTARAGWMDPLLSAATAPACPATALVTSDHSCLQSVFPIRS